MKAKSVLLFLALLLGSFSIKAATIQQTIQFSNTTPERLYQIFMSSQEYSAFTGETAVIDPREGGETSTFGGLGVGKILKLVPNSLIVQSWRAIRLFKEGELDATLILTFRKNEDGAEIEMVQANIPDAHRATVNTNWNLYYWQPLAKYIIGNPTAPASGK